MGHEEQEGKVIAIVIAFVFLVALCVDNYRLRRGLDWADDKIRTLIPAGDDLAELLSWAVPSL